MLERLLGFYNRLAEEGKGIILVSSELPEILGICDRIYVMHKGRLSGEIVRADFDPYVIGSMMAGGDAE